MSILLTPTSSHKPFVGPKSQHNTTPQPISPHHTLIYTPLCTISIQPSLPSLYLLIIVPTLISITRYATPFHLHIINDKISHLICPLGLPLPPPPSLSITTPTQISLTNCILHWWFLHSQSKRVTIILLALASRMALPTPSLRLNYQDIQTSFIPNYKQFSWSSTPTKPYHRHLYIH